MTPLGAGDMPHVATPEKSQGKTSKEGKSLHS